MQENVTTNLRVTGGASYSAALRSVGSAALGAGSSITGVLRMISPLRAALAGLAGGAVLGGIARVGDTFEMNRRVIAGTFASLGQASDFNQGLQLAAQTMQRIEIMAARLPGEAEEYVGVFRQALPQVQGAFAGASIDQLNTFTNRMTAIGRTMGIDSQQIARDMQLMLAVGRGRAGGNVRTFQSMMPFIEQVTRGTANHVTNAQEFNELSQETRGAILQQTIEMDGLQSMLNDAANSWDAQKGTLATIVRTITRLGSAPLFDAMKRGLASFNAQFIDADGNLTDLTRTIIGLGRFVSNHIVTAFQRVVEITSRLGAQWRTLADSPFLQRLADGARHLAAMARTNIEGTASTIGAGLATRGLATGAVAGATGVGALGGMGIGIAVGALFDLATRAGFLTQILSAAATTFTTLLTVLGPIIRIQQSLSGILADLVEAILPPLWGLFNALLEPLAMGVSALFAMYSVLIERVRPALAQLWSALGNLFNSIANLVGPALRMLAGLLISSAGPAFARAIQMVDVFARLLLLAVSGINLFASALNRVASMLGFAAQPAATAAAPATGGASSWIEDFLSRMRSLGTDVAAAGVEGATQAANRMPPSDRGGARVTQDFRNSRFDVTQRFAEGFDPDRIAVAFAQDLGRIGSERLQSGFEPMFTVR